MNEIELRVYDTTRVKKFIKKSQCKLHIYKNIIYNTDEIRIDLYYWIEIQKYFWANEIESKEYF